MPGHIAFPCLEVSLDLAIPTMASSHPRTVYPTPEQCGVSRRSLVHDQANGLGFEWSADEAERYRQCAKEMPDGTVHFDGRILDGWVPLPKLN